MAGIVVLYRLREFKDAWTLLPSFYDTTKIVGGILVCIVQGSVAMEQRSISQSIRSAHKERTVRMLHTFGTIEYRGEGLDIFILRNGNNVRPLRSFCVQNILHPVISGPVQT